MIMNIELIFSYNAPKQADILNRKTYTHVYESCVYAFIELVLCFSFGFYLRFVLVSENVDVAIQNMTFRPKGVAAVKPTNYIVCVN